MVATPKSFWIIWNTSKQMPSCSMAILLTCGNFAKTTSLRSTCKSSSAFYAWRPKAPRCITSPGITTMPCGVTPIFLRGISTCAIRLNYKSKANLTGFFTAIFSTSSSSILPSLPNSAVKVTITWFYSTAGSIKSGSFSACLVCLFPKKSNTASKKPSNL